MVVIHYEEALYQVYAPLPSPFTLYLDCVLGLCWTGLTLLNCFSFSVIFLFYFGSCYRLSCLTASFRAHVNIASLLTYLPTYCRLHIHVLGSPLMSAEATRMQDLASEFSKKIPGVTLTDPHSSRTQPRPQPGLWPGARRKRPGVGTQTLVPHNFSAVVAPVVPSRRTPDKLSQWVTLSFA